MRVPHGIRLDRPVTIDDGTDGGTTWDTWAALRTQRRDYDVTDMGNNPFPFTTALEYIVRYDPRLKTKMRITDRSETDVFKARIIRSVEHLGRRRYSKLTTFANV